jgi:hypothetical protein
LHGWSERLQVLSDVSMGVLENYFLAAQKVIAGTTERLAAG